MGRILEIIWRIPILDKLYGERLCHLQLENGFFYRKRNNRREDMSEEEKHRFLYPSKKELTETDKKMTKMSISEQIEYIFGKNR